MSVRKKLLRIEDGKIQIIGTDLDGIPPGTGVSLGIVVEVAGRKMQPDFEPIFERQMHRFLGEAQGFSTWDKGILSAIVSAKRRLRQASG